MDIREKKHRLPEGAYRGKKLIAFTLCVEDRKRPFDRFEILDVCKDLLTQSVEKYECVSPAYCFMPDHLHVVTGGKAANAKGKAAIEEFKHRSGQWFAEHHPSCHWQKDFHDHIIRNREDRANQIRYILGNPVRAGLAESFVDYPGVGSIGVDLIDYLRDLDEEGKFGGGY